MAVELLYWEKSVKHPAGHCSIVLGAEFVDYWLPVMDPADDHCKIPGQIVADKDLVQFTFGLRSLAFEDLRARKLKIPPGIAVYELLYNKFISEGADIANYEAWDILFVSLNKYHENIGDGIDVVKRAGIALGRFLQQWILNKKSYAEIIAKGAPTESCQLDFIDIDQAKNELVYLKGMEKSGNLLWYSKSGALCDFRLNSGAKPYLLSKAGSASGMNDYVTGKIRHNCASFALFILLRSGMSVRLTGFQEADILPSMLQDMIHYNAEAEGRAPNRFNVFKAGSLGVTSRSLQLFRYGPRPVTEWAGTAPDVVLAMSQYARDYQGQEHGSKCAVL